MKESMAMNKKKIEIALNFSLPATSIDEASWNINLICYNPEDNQFYMLIYYSCDSFMLAAQTLDLILLAY